MIDSVRDSTLSKEEAYEISQKLVAKKIGENATLAEQIVEMENKLTALMRQIAQFEARVKVLDQFVCNIEEIADETVEGEVSSLAINFQIDNLNADLEVADR